VTVSTSRVTAAVAGIDRWLNGSRVETPTPGYGGPVVHWWNHSLAYRGAGLDWRYEGIIDGYLTLWRRTGDSLWLHRARRAGNDLVAGQLPEGNFRNSAFELNPATGGTPHEAAADVGLLLLTVALGVEDGRQYFEAAHRNLESYLFRRLWDKQSHSLRDGIGADSFVPNKAATFIEAVLLLSEATDDPGLVERYAIPTADKIRAMQVVEVGDVLDGAIAQYRFGDRFFAAYFPLYIARCVPALLRMTEVTGNQEYCKAARRAIAFLQRALLPDGGFPHVLYPRGRRNLYPRWIAGAGDAVRAFDLARAAGIEADPLLTIGWILRGARADGRIATAEGFGRVVPIISRRDRFADEIGVAGWIDKAFRALAARVDSAELAGAMSGSWAAYPEPVSVPWSVVR
jgi:hypothetical protein